MKTRIKVYAILIAASIFFSMPQRTSAQEAGVSFQVFYDGLSPYGAWVDYPGYGYVWVPHVGAGFAPYSTGGHWVYTEYGWTWVSDYSWGWAPFHYGEWYFDDDYGWLWIPGEEWGPAWVNWRHCDGFYGWAPMGPSGLFIGASIPAERWCFVREGYITSPHVNRYYAPRSQNEGYIRNSTVIERTAVNNGGHVGYVYGPKRGDVEKSTGGHITPVSVHSSSSPGQSIGGNQLSIYRPTVSKSTSNSPHPAPAKVANLKEMPKRNAATTSNKVASNTQHSNHTASQPQKQKASSQNKSAPQQSHATQQQQAPRQQQQVQHTQHEQAPRQQQQVQHTEQQHMQPQQHQMERSMPPRQMQPRQGGGVPHHEEGGKK